MNTLLFYYPNKEGKGAFFNAGVGSNSEVPGETKSVVDRAGIANAEPPASPLALQLTAGYLAALRLLGEAVDMAPKDTTEGVTFISKVYAYSCEHSDALRAILDARKGSNLENPDSSSITQATVGEALNNEVPSLGNSSVNNREGEE